LAFFIICAGISFTYGSANFGILSKRPLPDALLGLFVGVFWVGATFVLFLITDSVFAGGHETPDYLACWAVAIFLNVLTQELILRGYIYTAVSRGYGAASAIAVSSLISLAVQGGIVQGGAAPIIFAVCASALYGSLRYYTGGLLAPFMAHLMWDLVGGFVLGLANLDSSFPRIFTEYIAGEDIISGGRAGFEGSALSVIICIALIDLIYIMANNRPEKKS
jgi:membrane protease YdiL (CAAX protease family)